MSRIAVFPVENLSGGLAPIQEFRQALIDALTQKGFQVLSDEALDAFMTKHRVRYAAGIDGRTAGALKEEAGIDGVMITSFELYSTTEPPKLALISRLISTTGVPSVVWAEDAGMAGDDSPGLLELGIVNNPQVLMDRALNRLLGSLEEYLAGKGRKDAKIASKFKPKAVYRGVQMEPDKQYSVAILPFFNLSERRNAGEILALQFVRHLTGFENLRIIEPGVVREQLLEARIIMDGGVSQSDADLVAATLNTDFILSGRVIYYQDYPGPEGRTRVEFSTILMERKSRKVVWSSESYNEGMDGVHFFERGRVRTAHAMASQMVRLAGEMMVGRK